MKILQEIRPVDVAADSKSNVDYTARKTSRAVVFDDDKKVAILYKAQGDFYKLPGGAIEEKEDTRLALKREILEEVGVEIEILNEIGSIVEYKDLEGIMQLSYCYTAKVVGKIGKPDFTEEEKAAGFKLEWAQNIEKAIRLVEESKPTTYEGKFIVFRDSIFLKEALKLIKISKNV